MGKYVLANIAKLALLLVASSFLVFMLVGLSPMDPLSANFDQASLASMSADKRDALASYWGKDAPILERYCNWLWGIVHGDLGTSLRYNAPVAEVIASRSANSLLLMSIAWIASGIIGFALGVISALNRGKLIDRFVKAYCFVLAASPTFWVALILLLVFSVGLGWFPIGFSQPIGKAAADVTIADALHHLALPAITLSVVGVANVALHTREKAIDVIESPYMRFAQTRGLSRRRAMLRHGLRNLVIPAITIQFSQIAEIFGGSVLVEQVFSYPGLGQAAVTAGTNGDVSLLAGIALVSAILVFSGNFIANLLYGVVDPQMRRQIADG